MSKEILKLATDVISSLHPAFGVLSSLCRAKTAIDKNIKILELKNSISTIRTNEESLKTLKDLSDTDVRLLTKYIYNEYQTINLDQQGLALCYIYIERTLKHIDQDTFELLMNSITQLSWSLLSSVKEEITLNFNECGNYEVLKAHGIVYISYEDYGDLDGSSASNTYSLTELGKKIKDVVETVDSIMGLNVSN